jgi:hypothetical protein
MEPRSDSRRDANRLCALRRPLEPLCRHVQDREGAKLHPVEHKQVFGGFISAREMLCRAVPGEEALNAAFVCANGETRLSRRLVKTGHEAILSTRPGGSGCRLAEEGATSLSR